MVIKYREVAKSLQIGTLNARASAITSVLETSSQMKRKQEYYNKSARTLLYIGMLFCISFAFPQVDSIQELQVLNERMSNKNVFVPERFIKSSNSKSRKAKTQLELISGLGGTNFLGDLGGADKIGKDNSLRDLDFSSSDIGISSGIRLRFHPFIACSSLLNIGFVRGNDSKTSEPVRNNRNLHFRSPIINWSQRIECILVSNERNRPRGFYEHFNQIYVFSGLGIVYFNPKAKLYGSWVPLRPLRTEGQGLPGGAKKYSRVTLTIPLGIGIRTSINREWKIGIEATYVKTFSDYIDDVHGTYYDPGILNEVVGPNSAYLSNPAKNPSAFNPGSKRGDKQKDALFYMNVTIYYTIWSKKRIASF